MKDITIQAEDLGHSYATHRGVVRALEGLSLEIVGGEVLVLLGASGCGKSTFLHLIAGLVEPTSGRVLFRGQQIQGVNPRCGMIFQNYVLFPWLTVRRNVEFGPRVSGISGHERRDRAQRILRTVGLSSFEDAYPHELSGGMQQRVALARALANRPEVLLCDEPFAALDAMTREALQGELLRIVEESRQTVVFVTHSIDEALILSDRIAILSSRPGRLQRLIPNPLPRPRKTDIQLSQEYTELKREVWSAVETEISAAVEA